LPEIEKERASRSSQSGEHTKCDISRTPSISGASQFAGRGAVFFIFFSLLGGRAGHQVVKQVVSGFFLS